MADVAATIARIAPGLSLPELIGKSALFGVAGWGMHNMLFKPRALEVTIDDADPAHRPPTHPIRIPFLPVYAVGGAAVLVAAQHVKSWPWPMRAAAYGGILTALEYAACQVDRRLFGAHSWDYGGGACVDWKHALAWAGLGMIAERFANTTPHDPGPPVPRGTYR